MKQDKGRGLVIMVKIKLRYGEMLSIMSTKQFQTLNLDPTKSTESKMYRMLRTMISKLPIQAYKRSYSDKFYGTTKLHKIQPNEHVDDLPVRPIVSSDIITTTCNLSKYLAKMLVPLRK